MKAPIWMVDSEGKKWLRDWKHQFNDYPRGERWQWEQFPHQYWAFDGVSVYRMNRSSREISNHFSADGREWNLWVGGIPEAEWEAAKPVRYVRPDYWVHKIDLMSLEGDIETDAVLDTLGWVGFKNVEIPKPPPWCGNCCHADCGNHGDETPYCYLLEQTIHGAAKVCPLYKGRSI